MEISRRRTAVSGLATLAVFAVIATGCSDSKSESLPTLIDASSTSEATTTAPPTTVADTTTTTPPSTTIPAPTTTLPPGALIALRPDGLGDALFGAAPEGVLVYITGILGPPTSDSGWVGAVERTCPGTEVRGVTWDNLTLLFGDDTGLRQFFGWSYGPPLFGEALSPIGMVTEAPAAIGIGSTVAQLTAAYPAASLYAGDDLVGPSASFGDGLFAFVTDISAAGIVTSLLGGGGCGE